MGCFLETHCVVAYHLPWLEYQRKGVLLALLAAGGARESLNGLLSEGPAGQLGYLSQRVSAYGLWPVFPLQLEPLFVVVPNLNRA